VGHYRQVGGVAASHRHLELVFADGVELVGDLDARALLEPGELVPKAFVEGVAADQGDPGSGEGPVALRRQRRPDRFLGDRRPA
jgi:hypothetical protein